MSHNEDMNYTPEELAAFYESIGSDWTEIEPPGYQAAFLGASSYCTEPMVPASMLTPISLPDSAFRPSPALSHHSQEYASQEYRYTIGDGMVPQGLGITAPFPSDFPRTSAPASSYVYASDDIQYSVGENPMSPRIPPPKRVKRRTSKSHTPTRETPVTILPHPEGKERLERERQNSRPPPLVYPRPRAPGRGRRDPQAEEEDAFVEDLRQQNTAWKVVRDLFRERFHKDATEARLQMRLLRRRKERLAQWEESDVQLLVDANEMWESERYRFIADKMKELGSSKEYTPEQCRTQLRLLEAKQQRQNGSASPSAMSDPPHSPTIPKSRKRAQPLSLEPE
ncbi:hypothetical protein N7488_000435 [Penicillium malachiteum]|nr:hypothetical protein N7488_000435 [Penicillium malachiteum]